MSSSAGCPAPEELQPQRLFWDPSPGVGTCTPVGSSAPCKAVLPLQGCPWPGTASVRDPQLCLHQAAHAGSRCCWGHRIAESQLKVPALHSRCCCSILFYCRGTAGSGDRCLWFPQVSDEASHFTECLRAAGDDENMNCRVQDRCLESLCDKPLPFKDQLLTQQCGNCL